MNSSYAVQEIVAGLGLTTRNPEIAVSTQRDEKPNATEQEIRAALQFLDSGCPYDEWLRIGMAINSEFPNELGFELWDAWSATSQKYNRSEMPGKWRSFNPNDGVTVLSLFKLARMNGYRSAKESTITPHTDAPSAREEPKKKRSPGVEDYVEFLRQVPGVIDFRHEILSGDLMIQMKDGRWYPAANQLPYLKGHARTYKKAKLVLEAIFDFLERYKIDSMSPRLLADFPAWDNVDRIAEIASVTRFSNVSSETFCQLMKQWLSQIFLRIDDCTLQPFTVLFVGPQGCGKDVLIAALTGGFGHYVKALNIGGYNLKEAEAQLHTGLVFIIEEFSRAARQAAALKAILTASQTDLRLSYDRRDQKRFLRCSFIGSDNSNNPLTDFTGNRRFWVFRAEYLGIERASGKVLHSYPGLYCRPNFEAERLQILAQAKHLADTGFRAPQSCIQEMQKFVVAATPDDPDMALVDAFDYEVRRAMLVPSEHSARDAAPLYARHDLTEVLSALRVRFHKSEQSILQILGNHGRREKRASGNFYRVAGALET